MKIELRYELPRPTRPLVTGEPVFEFPVRVWQATWCEVAQPLVREPLSRTGAYTTNLKRAGIPTVIQPVWRYPYCPDFPDPVWVYLVHGKQWVLEPAGDEPARYALLFCKDGVRVAQSSRELRPINEPVNGALYLVQRDTDLIIATDRGTSYPARCDEDLSIRRIWSP